jgi:hypothetical protein
VHQAIDLGAAGLRVLAAHPLPVQLDAEFVHLQCGSHAFSLGRPCELHVFKVPEVD